MLCLTLNHKRSSVTCCDLEKRRCVFQCQISSHIISTERNALTFFYSNCVAWTIANPWTYIWRCVICSADFHSRWWEWDTRRCTGPVELFGFPLLDDCSMCCWLCFLWGRFVTLVKFSQNTQQGAWWCSPSGGYTERSELAKLSTNVILFFF